MRELIILSLLVNRRLKKKASMVVALVYVDPDASSTVALFHLYMLLLPLRNHLLLSIMLRT